MIITIIITMLERNSVHREKNWNTKYSNENLVWWCGEELKEAKEVEEKRDTIST